MIFNFSKKLKHDIKIYYNIFSNKERKLIIEQFQPFLTRTDNYPGLQTKGNLHLFCKYNKNFFNPFEKLIKILNTDVSIRRSWINYTDIDISYENWHIHPQSEYKYIPCYMLENPEGIGTWFKVDGKVYKTRCPTNSLIVFPNYLLHTVPPIVKKPRYTLSIDFC